MTATNQTKAEILSQIEFGRMTRDELDALTDLITGMRSYNSAQLDIRSTSKEYFDWMYFRNPAGPAIVFRARHGDRIVSSFAMAPKRMQVGSRIVTCGKTMDMFTHPEYQGFGLVKRLTELVFEDALASGIAMWYVTPSVQSYPIFMNKWGYQEPFRVVYRTAILRPSEIMKVKIRPALLGKIAGIPLDAAAICLQRLKGSARSAYDIRPDTGFGPETDNLWQRAQRPTVALVRDAAYMNWRYRDNPDKYAILKFYSDRTLHGLLVLKVTLRQGLKTGEIVDAVWDATDPLIFNCIIRTAIEKAAKNGCAFVQAWSIEGTRQDASLHAAGLNLKRKKVNFVLSPGAPGEFYDKDLWTLAQGDGNDV